MSGKHSHPILDFERAHSATRQRVWTEFLDAEGNLGARRILLTGVEHGNGTSTVAGSCAMAFVRYLRRPIVLLEANTARPGVARLLGIRPGPGLTDVLRGTARLDESVQRTELPGLFVLASGNGPPLEPGEFTGSKVQGLLGALGEQDRGVVIDAPPILAAPETQILALHCDRTALVVCSGATDSELTRQAAELLVGEKDSFQGAILNRYEELGIGARILRAWRPILSRRRWRRGASARPAGGVPSPAGKLRGPAAAAD